MCEHLEGSFPTSLEQDQDLWKAGQFKSARHHKAVLIRGRTKEILHSLKELAAERWLSFLLKKEGLSNNNSNNEQQQQQQQTSVDAGAEGKKEEVPVPAAAQEAGSQNEIPLA